MRTDRVRGSGCEDLHGRAGPRSARASCEDGPAPEYERASPQTSRESDDNDDDDGRAMPGRKGRSSSTCPGLDGGGARGSHLATLSEFRGLCDRQTNRHPEQRVHSFRGPLISLCPRPTDLVDVNTPKDWPSNRDCTNITGRTPGDCHNGQAGCAQTDAVQPAQAPTSLTTLAFCYLLPTCHPSLLVDLSVLQLLLSARLLHRLPRV
eukprot:COSAG02_NODE_14443_length_1271_cov_2.209044_2_plen_207_part_00